MKKSFYGWEISHYLSDRFLANASTTVISKRKKNLQLARNSVMCLERSKFNWENIKRGQYHNHSILDIPIPIEYALNLKLKLALKLILR